MIDSRICKSQSALADEKTIAEFVKWSDIVRLLLPSAKILEDNQRQQ